MGLGITKNFQNWFDSTQVVFYLFDPLGSFRFDSILDLHGLHI